jgi:hypothetical protein
MEMKIKMSYYIVFCLLHYFKIILHLYRKFIIPKTKKLVDTIYNNQN